MAIFVSLEEIFTNRYHRTTAETFPFETDTKSERAFYVGAKPEIYPNPYRGLFFVRVFVPQIQ